MIYWSNDILWSILADGATTDGIGAETERMTKALSTRKRRRGQTP
jgi:hypothetical protein